MLLEKNGTDWLAQHSVATDIQFVKKKKSVGSVKYNKVEQNNKTVFSRCATVCLSIHLFERLPYHFLGLAIMIKPALNMCVQVFVWTYIFNSFG